MAIILTLLVFWLLPYLLRTIGFLMRLAVAAVIAQVVVRVCPDVLAVVPGVLTLALMAGAFVVMLGLHRD